MSQVGSLARVASALAILSFMVSGCGGGILSAEGLLSAKRGKKRLGVAV